MIKGTNGCRGLPLMKCIVIVSMPSLAAHEKGGTTSLVPP